MNSEKYFKELYILVEGHREIVVEKRIEIES